jgi:hypothetical protein
MEKIAEWNGNNGIVYRLFEIDRRDVDEGSDEPSVYNLVGIDRGGVRRVDVDFDIAYNRRVDIDEKDLSESLENAPEIYKDVVKLHVF